MYPPLVPQVSTPSSRILAWPAMVFWLFRFLVTYHCFHRSVILTLLFLGKGRGCFNPGLFLVISCFFLVLGSSWVRTRGLLLLLVVRVACSSLVVACCYIFAQHHRSQVSSFTHHSLLSRLLARRGWLFGLRARRGWLFGLRACPTS